MEGEAEGEGNAELLHRSGQPLAVECRMPHRIEHYGEGLHIGDCAVEDVHVFRAFLIRFVLALLYLAPIAIVGSPKTLKELARARSKYRTYPALEKVNCMEARVSKAVVGEVVICAASKHRFLWD